MWENIKRLGKNEQAFTCCLLIGTAVVAFLLGQQSVIGVGNEQSAQVIITENVVRPDTSTRNLASSTPLVLPESASTAVPTELEYVASRSGARYHHISCPGAKQIKTENKIYFPNPTAAEAAGYTKAANCQL